MKINWNTALVIALYLLASCVGCLDQVPDQSIGGTAWNLVLYKNETGTMTPVLEQTQITLRFAKDSTMSGSSGCNHYSGTYTVAGESFDISQIAWTEMFCLTPDGIMEQEITYLNALGEAKTYKLSDNELVLSDEKRDAVLIFEESL